MFSKLAQTAIALSSLMIGANCSVKTMVAGDTPQEVLKDYEFSVISFYKPSDETSVEIDALMEGAEEYMEKKMRIGDWSKRNVGWFRVNLEETPELAIDDPTVSDQVVVGPGMSRMIHFAKVGSKEKDDYEMIMAEIVRELTGDWVNTIECSEIQGANRWYFDEAVYFGKKEDLEDGGIADFFSKASMVDRFNFDEQRVGFFYTEDAECRRLRDLDVDKNYIVIYNGENSVPFILELGKDELNLGRMVHEINTGVVKGTPRWGQRAHSAVFNHMVNALIYMVPEPLSPDEMEADWRVMLMVRMIEMMQENDTSFVPILVPFEQNAENKMLVPQLSTLIEAKKEELPNFFVLHPLTD